MNEINENDILVFDYTNYKGEFSRRRMRFYKMYFKSTPYHLEPQFIMVGMDLDKRELRGFAMTDMKNVEVVNDGDSINGKRS